MRLVKSPLSGEPNAMVSRYPSWMRKVGLALAVCLVVALATPAPARASTADLVQQLDGLVSSFPGGAGNRIAAPTIAAPILSHDPEEQIIAASLYKLGVLAEAERQVDAGELHYNDVITIQPEDITVDGSYEDAGTQLTLDGALEAMITISDNGSALALWHMLGGANIDVTLEKAGVNNFHVAFDDTEDNWATPHAIGTFFTLLAKRELISPAASDRMLARLERQHLEHVERPPSFDEALATERRRIHERAAETTRYTDAERVRLAQLARERRSWNPLTRRAAAKEEERLHGEQRSRYEKALVTNDVVVLDATFRADPRTIRYGVGEILYGHDEIAAFRAARSPVGLARTTSRTVITTYGRDFAVASTLFHRATSPGKVGRQMQTWVRFPDGWRVVAAHVSIIDTPREA